jgi:hypothetical protein
LPLAFAFPWNRGTLGPGFIASLTIIPTSIYTKQPQNPQQNLMSSPKINNHNKINNIHLRESFTQSGTIEIERKKPRP